MEMWESNPHGTERKVVYEKVVAPFQISPWQADAI